MVAVVRAGLWTWAVPFLGVSRHPSALRPLGSSGRPGSTWCRAMHGGLCRRWALQCFRRNGWAGGLWTVAGRTGGSVRWCSSWWAVACWCVVGALMCQEAFNDEGLSWVMLVRGAAFGMGHGLWAVPFLGVSRHPMALRPFGELGGARRVHAILAETWCWNAVVVQSLVGGGSLVRGRRTHVPGGLSTTLGWASTLASGLGLSGYGGSQVERGFMVGLKPSVFSACGKPPPSPSGYSLQPACGPGMGIWWRRRRRRRRQMGC